MQKHYGLLIITGLLSATLVVLAHIEARVRANGPSHYDRVQLQRLFDAN